MKISFVPKTLQEDWEIKSRKRNVYFFFRLKYSYGYVWQRPRNFFEKIRSCDIFFAWKRNFVSICKMPFSSQPQFQTIQQNILFTPFGIRQARICAVCLNCQTQACGIRIPSPNIIRLRFVPLAIADRVAAACHRSC